MACEVCPDQTQQQKIQSLQHSIAFLQSQHATTLSSLHQEIERLQKKCKGINILSSLFNMTDFLPFPLLAVDENIDRKFNVVQCINVF